MKLSGPRLGQPGTHLLAMPSLAMPSLAELAKSRSYTITCNPTGKLGDCFLLAVPADQVMLLHDRLWVEDERGDTWVLADQDGGVWSAVPAKLPDSADAAVPIAGPEVRTVLRAKYLDTDVGYGRQKVWKRITLGARPVRWDGPEEKRVYAPEGSASGSDPAFVLANEPTLDVDGGTVWTATDWGNTCVSRGGAWSVTETIKVLYRTSRADGTAQSEYIGEIDVSDVEEEDDREWVERDGHRYRLSKFEVVDGVYLATRQV